jgi:hypothetical protein
MLKYRWARRPDPVEVDGMSAAELIQAVGVGLGSALTGMAALGNELRP